MCGIIGFNWEDKNFLNSALKSIHHRGPDAQGTFYDKKISLGHARLSILDLSELGKQPMSNENEDVWITFNGEIYNYKQIKKNLRKNHQFKSQTDTEILLHLYEEEGIEMLKKLQGMFAFCIYDSKKQIFFLARDRVGIKPLYYYHFGKKFIFCSEIKGILADSSIKKEVNPDALSSFLIFRANTTSETMFKGIKKLEPGHLIIYNLKTNEILNKKYWDVEISEEEQSEKFFIGQLKGLLEDSVHSRLMSDVPYGAYLSGGVDSGTIVSLMSRFSPSPVKTFSVGFEEEAEKETDEAKFLAEKIGTDHRELLINKSSIKHLPEIVYHLDEPMSDPTSIPIYLLSKYAKKYCTVILTGEGADEIFAGYPQYKFMKLHDKFAGKIPKQLKKAAPNLIRKTPSFILNKGFRFASSLGDKGIERFSNFLNSYKKEEQYLEQVSIFNEEEQSEIFGKKIRFYPDYSRYFKDKNNLITGCELLDFKGPMVEDLLMKLDKNTMAFAVEGRVPFLDYRVVELAFKMPENIKLKGLKDKYILRKSVKGLIPNETLKRKKRHFFVPIDLWLSDELSPLIGDLLSERYINKQGIFKYNYIEKINREFKNSRLFYSRQLWSLLTFQIWYKRFIENEKIKI